MLPSFEAAGHWGSAVFPTPNWASVQPASPSAAAGLIEVPSGSVTTAFFRFDSVIPVGFWGWGRSTSTDIEVGESELCEPDWTLTEGSKGTALQPVAPTGVVEVRLSIAPFCHELARRTVSTGAVPEVGLERKGSTGPCEAGPALGVVAGVAGHAPEGEAGAGQRQRLGDVGDGHREPAVVAHRGVDVDGRDQGDEAEMSPHA